MLNFEMKQQKVSILLFIIIIKDMETSKKKLTDRLNFDMLYREQK